jgi:hypothetical protein
MAPPFFPPKNTKIPPKNTKRISNNTKIPQKNKNNPKNTKKKLIVDKTYFLGPFLYFLGEKSGGNLYFLEGFLSFFGGIFVFSGLVFNFILYHRVYIGGSNNLIDSKFDVDHESGLRFYLSLK